MREPWLQHLEDLLDDELATGSVHSPFRPAILRWAEAYGRAADPEPLLGALEANRIGGRGGSRRYRWGFPVGRWMPAEEQAGWRPLEAEAAERHPDEQAGRLWVPAVLAEHIEWLERTSRSADAGTALRARRLLEECTPTLEDDVARYVMGADPWADTFMLWVFTRRTRALTHVRGLASAIGARYAARAKRSAGLVEGRSYPFFHVAMPSATAHLASAAARIGEGIDNVAPAVAWLKTQRNPDGGWGDPRQGSDVLTTLAVAELMGQLDPAFDPGEALDPLGRMVAARGGRPELIGPEWPWVAGELLAFADWAAKPFKERFRWPHVADWAIDHRVAVPRFEAYLVYARLFEQVPGLASTPVEIAFLDLANFGHWNTAYGMAAGDDLLAALTAELRTLPESRTIRDGGDEFLVVGAPEASGLEERLRALSAHWAEVSRVRYPGLPVVPIRALVVTTSADGLRAARDELGDEIGPLKNRNLEPPPEGVVERNP